MTATHTQIRTFDIVVYGATPAGIATAVRAAREGLRVLLVNHARHLGGFLTSGAGGWETPCDYMRSPIFTEVRQAITKHYRETYGEGSQQHLASMPQADSRRHIDRAKVEPRVAEQVFDRLVADEPRITVWLGWIPVAAQRDGAIVRTITFEATADAVRRDATASVFVDAGYEGDLATVAGAAMRVGRESREEYGEPHAGRLFVQHQVPPVPGQPGWPAASCEGTLKIAWNAGRLIGPQHDYPEGDRETRRRIDRQYRDFIVGQLYYLQNAPDVPSDTQTRWQAFGLARDEFPDNAHLPYAVYAREARRLVGRYVFTEHDGLPMAEGTRTPVHADSIATTDWPLDSVACNAETVAGSAMDGIMFLAEQSRPAQVPYRCLLPQGVDNLLVPVCLSASHVGWGPIRLEPVWMQTGEAAGFAAALALRQHVTPAALAPGHLVRTMAEAGCMVSFFNDVDPAGAAPWIPAVQVLGTLGFFDDYDARPDEPLGTAYADAWTARWRELSATAGTLAPSLARAEAAMSIFADLPGEAHEQER